MVLHSTQLVGVSPHLGHVLQLLLGLLLPQEVETAGDLHLPAVVEDVHREEQQLEDAAVIIQAVSPPPPCTASSQQHTKVNRAKIKLSLLPIIAFSIKETQIRLLSFMS